jgi:hypothetical protein
MPAFIALLLSMAFTLLAIEDQHAATIMAAPVAIVALGLMMLSSRSNRKMRR